MSNSTLSPGDKTNIPLIYSHRTVEPKTGGNQNEFDCTLKTEWQGTADMDLSCVGFTQLGAFVDAAYYNKKHDAFDACVQHPGDSRTESEINNGDVNVDEIPDEVKNTITSSERLNFKLASIKPSVSVLAIVMTCYEGSETKLGDWSDISFMQAQVQVPSHATNDGNQENGDWIMMAPNPDCAGKYEALIVGYFYRSEKSNNNNNNNDNNSNETNSHNWIFHSVMKPINRGRVFVDVVPDIRQNIGDQNIIDPVLLEECKWSSNVPKSFELQKEETFELPSEIDQLFVGLGWDTTCDLDSSVIPFDDEGLPIFKDLVYFGNQKARGIKHHGDNMTGEGKGDDEVIEIDLKSILSHVKTLIVVINIYTQGYTFQNVSGAYVRLVDQNSSQEMCRYKLQKTGPYNAMLMCKLERAPPIEEEFAQHESLKRGHGEWRMTCLGDPSFENMAKETARNISPLPYERRITTSYKLEMKMILNVLEGKDLVACDRNGKSDPYVKIRCAGDEEKTSTQKKTLNPKWNEEFTFEKSIVFEDDKEGESREFQKEYFREQFSNIDFEVRDYDRITSDDDMGCARFTFDSKMFTEKMLDLQKTGTQELESGEQELELKPKKDEKVSGTIKFRAKLIKTMDVVSEIIRLSPVSK